MTPRSTARPACTGTPRWTTPTLARCTTPWPTTRATSSIPIDPTQARRRPAIGSQHHDRRPSGVPHSWFETDAQPLPALLTSHELTTARIIKIDVEGAEAAAITGLAPHLHQLHHDAELAIEISLRMLRKLGRCVDDVLDPLLACGFHPYLLANDYQAHSYPDAMRQPSPPVRLHPPYEGLRDPSDLVLSRTDVDYLP